jgi:ABC-type phosphate/phosphonate transport system substrate-binding protein
MRYQSVGTFLWLRGFVVFFLLMVLFVFCCSAAGGEKEGRQTVQIGVAGSLFRGIPQPLVQASMRPFGALMEAQTGIAGEMCPMADADQLAQQLNKDELQLGVFHGVEFAWVRQTYPALTPLVVILSSPCPLRAHLLVRQDSSATSLASLRSLTLALPSNSPEHCRLFVERQCRKAGKEPQAFFDRITTPSTSEDALDDVVDGLVHGAVVDGAALHCYGRRKSGRCARLKEVQQSEIFPAAVIAFHTGALDPATLQRFREALLKAHQQPGAKHLLTLWRINGFKPVPSDYEQTLTNIARTYPQKRKTGDLSSKGPSSSAPSMSSTRKP